MNFRFMNFVFYTKKQLNCVVAQLLIFYNFCSRFSEPVRFQPNIIPICIPEDDYDFIGDTGFVSGWGRLYEGKSAAQRLNVFIFTNVIVFWSLKITNSTIGRRCYNSFQIACNICRTKIHLVYLTFMHLITTLKRSC